MLYVKAPEFGFSAKLILANAHNAKEMVCFTEHMVAKQRYNYGLYPAFQQALCARFFKIP
jgi:hypothetical protein